MKQTGREEAWWCAVCNQSYRTPLPATEVRCKKGHKMKNVSSAQDFAREKAKEGVK